MDRLNEKRTDMVIEIINRVEKDTGKKIKDISIDINKDLAEFDMISFFEDTNTDHGKPSKEQSKEHIIQPYGVYFNNDEQAWIAETFDVRDGAPVCAKFHGYLAREKANEYADWRNANAIIEHSPDIDTDKDPDKEK